MRNLRRTDNVTESRYQLRIRDRRRRWCSSSSAALLTTVVPPLIDKSWASRSRTAIRQRARPASSKPYTEIELKGRAIYVREGCWYCHTQQTRTLLADTKRSGWKGVDSPISTPDEFVYDSPHMFGTKRTGPDLRASAASTTAVASHALPQSAGSGSRLRDAAVSVDRQGPGRVHGDGGVLQTLGRAKNWRPDDDYEK